MTAKDRENKRYQDQLVEYKKRYRAAVDDHKLTLAEQQLFQDALDNIKREHHEKSMRDDASVVNFSKLLRAGEYMDAMAMAEKMTAGLATHSRAAFEINKASTLARATISGYRMIQDAATDGAEWGGYYGAIVEGALAAAYVATNLDAISGTTFGGSGGGISSAGGGGGIPSLATTPGTPVNIPASPVNPTSTLGVAAQAPQQVNITLVGDRNSAISYDQMVNQVIPTLKQALGNGIDLNVQLHTA